MYHAIVRNQVRKLFDAVNAGDATPVLKGLARRFEHVFLGGHALGGKRTSLKQTREWYARLYRLMPDISFTVRSIEMAGGPWKTLVIVEWDESNSGVDGVRTTNHGVHAIELRWGRMARIFICPDTVALEQTLDRMAEWGLAEAHASPLIG